VQPFHDTNAGRFLLLPLGSKNCNTFNKKKTRNITGNSPTDSVWSENFGIRQVEMMSLVMSTLAIFSSK
jgi:hypothetical protein